MSSNVRKWYFVPTTINVYAQSWVDVCVLSMSPRKQFSAKYNNYRREICHVKCLNVLTNDTSIYFTLTPRQNCVDQMVPSAICEVHKHSKHTEPQHSDRRIDTHGNNYIEHMAHIHTHTNSTYKYQQFENCR